MTRSNRRFTVATVRNSAFYARTGTWSARGARKRSVPRRERRLRKQCWSVSQCWGIMKHN
eukprot:710202-Lingulodinium_polyedra.AAC.1